jgi:hypothetical protein
VYENAPSEVGVPLIVPVAGFKASPPGNDPPVMANWYAPVPPEAMTGEL